MNVLNNHINADSKIRTEIFADDSPYLQAIILKHEVDTSCDDINPNSVCMKPPITQITDTRNNSNNINSSRGSKGIKNVTVSQIPLMTSSKYCIWLRNVLEYSMSCLTSTNAVLHVSVMYIDFASTNKSTSRLIGLNQSTTKRLSRARFPDTTLKMTAKKVANQLDEKWKTTSIMNVKTTRIGK